MWSGLGQFTTQGFNVIIKIVLARLLFPEDFGILSMALVIIFLMQLVSSLGLESAIIQRKNINDKHISTSFYISIGAGIVLCIFTFIISYFIALFFENKLLELVIKVLSLTIVAHSFGVVPLALLKKKINFRAIAFVEICSVIILGVVSITLAYFGFGVWSLVVGLLLEQSVKSFLLCFVCSLRINATFNFMAFKELFGFGRNVLGSQVLNYFGSNIHYLLIGKFLNVTELGFYTFAYQMAAFPLLNISFAISKVVFPAFADIQDETIRLRKGYLKTIKHTSFITFPLLTGLAVISPIFVPLAIGVKWCPMILPLQILCIMGAIKSIETYVGVILLSKGRSDIQFKWNIFTAIALPIAVLIGLRYGIVGIAFAHLIMECVLSIIIQNITNQLINLKFIDFLKALYPATICSIILAISILLFQRISTLFFLPNIVIFICLVVIGAILYISAIRIIDRNSFEEILDLIGHIRS